MIVGLLKKQKKEKKSHVQGEKKLKRYVKEK